MIWFILALLAAVFDAIFYAFSKKITKKINYYSFGAGVYLTCGIILFLLVLINGMPSIGNRFYSALLISAIINISVLPLYYKAIKITDLSLAIPMLSFTPAFLIITSYIFLNEKPTNLGIIGIILIVIGSYILNINKKDRKLLDPLKSIFQNKGSFYMLLMAVLVSISINFDKIMIQNSNALLGSSLICLIIGSLTLIVSFAKIKNARKIYQKHLDKFIIIGIILALASIFTNLALKMQIPPYVISIKRLSVLFSILLGSLMFKEKYIFKKSLGAIIMIIGVINV